MKGAIYLVFMFVGMFWFKGAIIHDKRNEKKRIYLGEY